MNQLSEDFKERVNRLYESLDCKYFVFKIKDLLDCIDENDYLSFIDIMKKYNQHREQQDKKENFYFVVNRDDFSRFQTAKDFFEWLHNKNDRVNK